jgi:hypothetical protein
VPAPQRVQEAWMPVPDEYVPAAHDWHAPAVVMPVPVEKVPAPHRMQLALAGRPWAVE